MNIHTHTHAPDAIHQPSKVAHAEKLGNEWPCAEYLELINMLSCANENDGTLCGSHRAQCTTPLGMAVKLRDDHGTHIYFVLECSRLYGIKRGKDSDDIDRDAM